MHHAYRSSNKNIFSFVHSRHELFDDTRKKRKRIRQQIREEHSFEEREILKRNYQLNAK